MNEHRPEQNIGENAASRMELEQLLSNQTLSATDKQRIRCLLKIVTTLEQLPKERFPDSLLVSLYALEQPSISRRLIIAGRNMFRTALWIVGGAVVVLALNDESVSIHFFLLSTATISVIVGLVIYDLFKSRFFSL